VKTADGYIEFAAVDEDARDPIEKHERDHDRSKARKIGHVRIGEIGEVTPECNAESAGGTLRRATPLFDEPERITARPLIGENKFRSGNLLAPKMFSL